MKRLKFLKKLLNLCRWRIPLSGSLKVWNDTNWHKFKSSKHFQTSETSFPNLLMFWLQNVKQILFKRWKKWRMLYWLTWTVLPETQALSSIPACATTFLVHDRLMFMNKWCYLLQACFLKLKEINWLTSIVSYTLFLLYQLIIWFLMKSYTFKKIVLKNIYSRNQ